MTVKDLIRELMEYPMESEIALSVEKPDDGGDYVTSTKSVYSYYDDAEKAVAIVGNNVNP